MRAAEFLRGIADMLAAIEDDNPATPTVIVNVNGNNTAPVVPEIEDSEDTTDGSGMVFPQQQKIEIMKKMAGIPSQSNNLKTIAADENESF
jgi:hypothetical protein